MTTILANSFSDSLSKLANQEQKQAKLSAFDLQTNPEHPGLKMHRIDKSRDENFWSVRVSRDLRIIVHKTGDSLMLCYVDHHDDAYKWAERRRIETHPRTGALQIVVARELVESVVPERQQSEMDLVEFEPDTSPTPVALFARLDEDALLDIGVPTDWIGEVQSVSEEGFFDLSAYLPQEAGEALLEFAASGRLPEPVPATAEPLQHPDSMRRFRVLEDVDELQAALDDSFEKWTIFLHPAQRGVVNQKFSGPARVAGSAGTGKTVVALHRVAQLLRSDPRANVLLATFSEPLARALNQKLSLLFGGNSPLRERATVASFSGIAAELVTLATGRKPHLATDDVVRGAIARAKITAAEEGLTDQFLYSEWTHVVDAWQINDPEAYAQVPRMGRKNRLGARQRKRVWQVLGQVRENLASRRMQTEAGLFARATEVYASHATKPFTHIVVDEAQDLAVPELRFLASIAPDTPDALFFAGDLGQRIFQQPFSWLGLGIDVRGRSATLKVNYRTSHQIRTAADRLLPKSVRDADGLEDDRGDTVSVFNGPEPDVRLFSNRQEEMQHVASFLTEAVAAGTNPKEIGVFVRSGGLLHWAREATESAGLSTKELVSSPKNKAENSALVGVMHLAKGLEFKVVVVMACDEDVLPLSSRIADVADEFELDEVLTTERQLLYVALTRARDSLLVTGLAPGSQFLDDLVN